MADNTGQTYQDSTGGYTSYERVVDDSGNSHYIDSYTDKHGNNHTVVYHYDSHSSYETYTDSSGNTSESYNSYSSGK